jgi:hypothetical protein
MRKNLPAALVVLSLIAAPSIGSAQDAQLAGAPKAAVSAELAVGTAVAERQLTGMGESFPASTGALYCYMKVANAANAQVEHVWYKGDTEMSRVKLNVTGSPWRTWSTRKFGAGTAGDWRCDLVVDGKTVQSAKFKIE